MDRVLQRPKYCPDRIPVDGSRRYPQGMRQPSRLGLITLAAFIWGGGPAAQTRSRSDGNVVRVVATVNDRDNQMVSNLMAADFEVEDNGVRQVLTSFDAGIRPLTVTVILDRSDSMSLGPNGLRAAAERFVTGLLPDDQARICSFANFVACSPGYTTDHDELGRDVRRSKTGFGSRLFDAIASGIEAMAIVPEDRRRVLLVFSDGEDRGSRTTLRAVIDRARALDVMVYGLGLQTRYFDGDDFVDSRPDRTLMKLADETGGGYFEPDKASDLVSTVERIDREVRSQYLLSFRSSSADGRVHRLRVRMRASTFKVRARRSYLNGQ
jgi:Ca-activated chloride channel homolog